MPTSSPSLEMLSPTGCTKQLIKVALSSVPAAELMRPPRMSPFCCARKNASSQRACRSGASTAANARATRRRTSSAVRSSPLAYFSSRTSAAMACGGSSAVAGGSGIVISFSFISHSIYSRACRALWPQGESSTLSFCGRVLGHQPHRMGTLFPTHLQAERTPLQTGVIFRSQLAEQRPHGFGRILRPQPADGAGERVAILGGKLPAPVLVRVDITRALQDRRTAVLAVGH